MPSAATPGIRAALRPSSGLGASYEGTLRGHRFAPDGSRCDTAVFSILREEWPHVREALLGRLAPFELADNHCAYVAEPARSEHAA
ncbi:GNAT family protein [Arthrobacter sp. efr-133-R2A-63]|uniref:GNAT family N-acetyltransferase n=1 Tax=Arthrobacter sp. efr-133-R2A-63 TaxID=3040278 RepID=UPI00254D6C59|nr:GNAT family protein [Arthrobacter sp. efr-133-R2A-63]